MSVPALATVADSAEFLIELIKVIARCFFQVSHPGSCRIYVLFQLERKMYLTQECELKLASHRPVTSALLKLVTIFFFFLGLLQGLLYQHITSQWCSDII